MRLPRLYPIADASAPVSIVEQVEAFARGGATLIQVRDKHATGRELYDAVTRALAVARPLGVRIIVNDRVDIALAAGADGVHVGQDDIDAADARAIVGAERIVGVSTHSVVQARIAARLPVDYLAIGPVFPTTTKANPDPVVGLGGVREVRGEIGALPLVAIGGVTIGNAGDAIGAGADSVAVIGDLWSSEGPAARVAAYLALLACAG